MRRLLIACLALALSGCWAGLSLFHPSDAVRAIPPGAYMASAAGEPQRVYRVSALPNGMTQFDSNDEKRQVYGFAPLDPGSFVGWWEIELDPVGRPTADAENQMYALMVRRADGRFAIYLPSCEDEDASLARKHGAVVGTGASPTCRFSDRAGLENALRRLPRRDADAMILTRIP